jgi:predicted peroxiredoxin
LCSNRYVRSAPRRTAQHGSIVGTYGSDDPARAAFPLLGSKGAPQAGHEADVISEAAYLMKPQIAAALNPVGWPNVGETLAGLVEQGVPFHI